jgi:molybdopterin molybdotransferase
VASTVAERRSLGYADARGRVLSATWPLEPEAVPLAEAVGRALRDDAIAPHPLPPFRNSSMDGFAVRATDLAAASAELPLALPVQGVIAAGAVPEALDAGFVQRIMTGAMLPEGADAVVPFEEVTGPSDPSPRFTRAPHAGAAVREAGADVAEGERVMLAGRDLSAHDLALLGALGFARVRVGPRPRVAILSTGDELLDIDAPLRPGAIRDTNLPLLTLLVHEAGGTVVSAERVRDDPQQVARALRESFEAADVTLTIGGVSMGDFDPVRQSLAALATVEWWRVAMKPGQPQAFGTPHGKLFFGLPGNPASVTCVFEALVRPALRRLQGHTVFDRPTVTVKAGTRIESRAGRTDFVRATLAYRDGAWWARPAGEQISGHLGPQSRAHALLIVPEAAEELAAGDSAMAWVLRWPDPPAQDVRA